MNAIDESGAGIEYEEIGHTAVITLNSPERLNTFRQADYLALIGYLKHVRSSRKVRALIITGKGRAFSAGQDLSELDPDNLPGLEKQTELLERFQEITRTLISIEVPTITAFNGFAVGVGLEIAIACDFRIAAPDAYFLFAEARRGLFPTNGVLWLLPRLIGLTRAKEMLLFAKKCDADFALQAGLLTEIAPADKLQARALEMVDALAANSGDTIRGVKSLLKSTFDITLEEMMREEIRHNIEIMKSPDFAEGLSSFFEKRSAAFNSGR